MVHESGDVLLGSRAAKLRRLGQQSERRHVDDVRAAVEKLLSMGAEEYLPVTEREAGFVTAAVADPFGNILGVMYNPHCLEVLRG